VWGRCVFKSPSSDYAVNQRNAASNHWLPVNTCTHQCHTIDVRKLSDVCTLINQCTTTVVMWQMKAAWSSTCLHPSIRLHLTAFMSYKLQWRTRKCENIVNGINFDTAILIYCREANINSNTMLLVRLVFNAASTLVYVCV